MQFVLSGMHNRTFDPYLGAINRIPISLMCEERRLSRWLGACVRAQGKDPAAEPNDGGHQLLAGRGRQAHCGGGAPEVPGRDLPRRGQSRMRTARL
jgi:hypothetical protein